MNSVRECILEELQNTLSAITKDNGYNNNIANVQRWRQRGNSLKEIPCIIINTGIETKEPGPFPLTTCKFSIQIDVWIRQSDDDERPTETLLNSLLVDIEKALMQDYTRGNKAQNTNLLSIAPFETVEGQPYAGLILEVEVLYRHLQTDPAVAG
jgi:hypothetical protein